MAKLIRVDGTVTEVQPKNGTDFQFVGEAYDLIGTDMIQIVGIGAGNIMLLDENGKNKGKPFNHVATQLYPYGGLDPIVGDVLVCLESEVR